VEVSWLLLGVDSVVGVTEVVDSTVDSVVLVDPLVVVVAGPEVGSTPPPPVPGWLPVPLPSGSWAGIGPVRS
jgi:hypothetical protein